jgi:flavin reductase (DIM6/NTAB) family NADH-FMN oxidoreductase RutF
MKHYTSPDISQLDRIFRINLINSISGFKSANLIGTRSSDGLTNLAIFSSVIHIGANPPLLGFIMRPPTVPRDTYENIRDTGQFTINHIHSSFIKRAHYTSAKFDKETSEFEACGLTEEYFEAFKAPYVGESQIKIGLDLEEIVPIQTNGTLLIIGRIQHIFLPQEAIRENGIVNLAFVDDVCISGLQTYHEVSEIGSFPYAKAKDINQSLFLP